MRGRVHWAGLGLGFCAGESALGRVRLGFCARESAMVRGRVRVLCGGECTGQG